MGASGGRSSEGVVSGTNFEDAGERNSVAWGNAFEFWDGEDVVWGEEVAAAEEEGRDVVGRLGGEEGECRGSPGCGKTG
jgi:hypothetical protein